MPTEPVRPSDDLRSDRSAEAPVAARRPALRWLAAGLILPLLAACRTDGGVAPTPRPTRWPPGGR